MLEQKAISALSSQYGQNYKDIVRPERGIHRVVLIDIYQPRAVPPSKRLSRLSTVSIESPPASSLSGHGRYRSDLGPSAMAGIDPI